MTTTPPPGWYDTGIPGEQGWWDGRQWTPHRRPVPQAPVPSAPGPQVATSADAAPRPWRSPAPAAQPPATPSFGWGPPWLSITIGAIFTVVSVLTGFLLILIMAFGAALQLLLTGFAIVAVSGVLAGLAFANAAGASVKRRAARGEG